MAVKTKTFHIAVCDVTGCGAEFDATGDHRYWDDTPELALEHVRDDEHHWTIRDDDTVICPTSDTAHYLVRGGESSAVLEAGPDAMTVRFGDQIDVRIPAA